MSLSCRIFAVLALIIGLIPSAFAADYCLAIRGNGELEPAHWGAIAKVVETLGLPVGQAGGSSASITMLLTDAIATNRLVKTAPKNEQGLRAALLIKSLEGFVQQLAVTPEWTDFMTLYKNAGQLKDKSWTQDLSDVFTTAATEQPSQMRAELQGHLAEIERSYATGVKLGILGPDNYSALFQALTKIREGGLSDQDLVKNVAITRFYASELNDALKAFGHFNAETDNNLFFRPSLVNFDRLANQFGRIADFYSMVRPAPREREQWEKFFADCTQDSATHSWEELLTADPVCGSELGELMKTHFQGPEMSFAEHAIGISIPSLVTTTVLTGTAHTQAVKAQQAYDQAALHPQDNPIYGFNFSLPDTREVKFGYFGRDEWLATAKANLDPADEKSSRFLPLGQVKWKTALGLSPAEPGLSPLKAFNIGNSHYTSAGGWSDLHPVQVLQAAGCSNVVYITRRGGESVFGQGVAKRLLKYDRSWNLISSSHPDPKLNNTGDPIDMTSVWSRLYNLANPNSSYKRALSQAALIVCTDWDKHEITEGVSGMINDAWASPYYVPAGSGLANAAAFEPRLIPAEQFAGCY